MSEEQSKETARAANYGTVNALVREFFVRGSCIVPCEVALVVNARSATEAVEIAKKSNWKHAVDANGMDASAAYDWEPDATEINSANARVSGAKRTEHGMVGKEIHHG